MPTVVSLADIIALGNVPLSSLSKHWIVATMVVTPLSSWGIPHPDVRASVHSLVNLGSELGFLDDFAGG
jgi:hypothetical protein